MYELLVAARTNDGLRRALGPSIHRYYAAIRDAARGVPGVKSLPPGLLETLLFAAIHLFDGEALVQPVYPRPAIEEDRLAMVTTWVKLALGGGG
jgi:hypothetical protein